MENRSYVCLLLRLWGITGVVGTIAGMAVLFGGLLVLQDLGQHFSSSWAIFIASLITAVGAFLVGLKLAIRFIEEKTAVADPEVRHLAISLVVVGITGFLLIFLSFGILNNQMGYLRFAMGGGAALFIGAVLYVFGIVWLDEISIPKLEQKRPIATKKDTVLFIGFLLFVAAAFFAVANKDYFHQQRLDRDTARVEDIKEIGEDLRSFYHEYSRFPDTLEELANAGFQANIKDPFRETLYLYYFCEEEEYFHLGAEFESMDSGGLALDRDAEPCDDNDFSGADPIFDFIGHPPSPEEQ